MESGQRAWKDRESGQAGLFWHGCRRARTCGASLARASRLDCAAEAFGGERSISIFVTGHPLDEYSDKAAELSTHDTETVEGLERGAEVAIGGILTCIQRKRNKDGKPGRPCAWRIARADWKPWRFRRSTTVCWTSLVEDQAVLVRGLVLPEENSPSKISIQDIVPLQLARVNLPTLISIRVGVGVNGTSGASSMDKAEELNQLFARKRGETEVRLRLEKPRDFSVILKGSQGPPG